MRRFTQAWRKIMSIATGLLGGLLVVDGAIQSFALGRMAVGGIFLVISGCLPSAKKLGAKLPLVGGGVDLTTDTALLRDERELEAEATDQQAQESDRPEHDDRS
jgi:hypothetical protein